MLGRELVRACLAQGRPFHAFGRAGLDVTDAADVRIVFERLRPALVINAAGFTNVDGAEANPGAAMRVNGEGADILAAACARTGARLLHFSTDYLFDGESATPYGVDAAPNPLNVYGRSKLAGEEAIRASGAEHLIVRASWMFATGGANFVRTILDLAASRPAISVVNDQVGRPTSARDLAERALALAAAGARGVVHAANEGACTWFDLAAAAVREARLTCRVRPCTTAEFPRPARRPRYSVLDTTSADSIIGPARPWREALAECVEDMPRARYAATG
jgi:dTDP-4-dehydrorhamnose reductase